jgi:hypothetical protein
MRVTPKQLAALEAKAEALPGIDVAVVPLNCLWSVLKVSPGRASSLERRGLLTPMRVRVEPGFGRDSHGVRVCVSLEQVRTLAADGVPEIHRRWSVAEDAYLRQHVGRQSIAQMAAELGRSYESTKARIQRLLGSARQAAAAVNGLMSLSMLARMLNVEPGTVRSWARLGGMPSVSAGLNGHRYVRVAEVRAWLKGRWRIAVNLRPEALDRLRLVLRDGQVLDAPGAPGAANGTGQAA